MLQSAFINQDDNTAEPYLYIDDFKHQPEDIPFTFMEKDNEPEYVYIEATTPKDKEKKIKINIVYCN